MANAKNYTDSIWHNQTIDGQLVSSVRVRIFKPRDIITTYECYIKRELVATDGIVVKRSHKGFALSVLNFSYAIFSSGICEKGKGNTVCLQFKVYLNDDFDLSMLNNKDFVGKAYVIEAIQGGPSPEPVLPPLQTYLCKKMGFDYEEIYHLLKTSAQNYDTDKVEQLFEDYKISSKYQTLFWKEMYLETK